MTAFDDRLYRMYVGHADHDGTVIMSLRDQAGELDVSERSISDSQRRLERSGRIIIIHKATRWSAATVRVLTHVTESGGDLTEGLRSDATQGARACEREPDPPVIPAGKSGYNPKPPTRDVDPECRVCEGSGWVELPDRANTVEPCRCVNPEWRNLWRQRRRDFARTWPADHSTETDRPARADYMQLWVERARRRLRGPEDYA
jgi:hypothetical protein